MIEELVRSVQRRGDRAALERLIQADQEAIYNFLRRQLGQAADAEDATQEVFQRVVRGLPSLRTPAAYRGWLYRLASNVAQEALRDRGVRTTRLRKLAPVGPAGDSAMTPLEDEERRRVVLGAVDALEPELRQAVLLRYEEGLSYAEIAEATGALQGTVAKRLHTAHERLQRTLAGAGAAVPTAMLLGALAGVHEPVPAGLAQRLSRLARTAPLAEAAFAWKAIGAAVVVVALAGMLAVGAWYARYGSPAPANAAAEAKSDSLAARGDGRNETEERGIEADKASADAKDREAAGTGDSADADGKLRITGTIVVSDSTGNEFPEEDGTFALFWSSEEEGCDVVEVSVKKGRWSAQIPRKRALAIYDLVLGGRKAADSKGYFPVPANREVHLRARWLEQTLLHVIARDTREELSGIEVVRPNDHVDQIDHPVDHPGGPEDYRVVLSDQRSPVPMPLRSTSSKYWVRAPGFAWQRLALDPFAGGELRVELLRGGSLSISLVNYRPDSGAVIRLVEAPAWGGSSRPLLETRPDSHGFARVTDIKEGTYGVRVEVGRWFSHPIILGTAKVDVRALQEATVTLELKEAPAVQQMMVEAHGTLRVPDGWGDERVSLVLSPIDDEAKGRQETVFVRSGDVIRGSNGLYVWNAGKILPGRYTVRVRPFGVQGLLVVGADGQADPSIEVPEPAEVIVRVLGADTSAPLEGVHEVWAAKRPEGYKGQHDRSINLRPGPNESSVALKRAQGVWVTLRDGHRRVRVDELYGIELVGLDGSKETTATSWDWSARTDDPNSWQFGRTIAVDVPGRYRLIIPDIEGFEPVPPQEVTVEAGVIREVAIDLKRKP